MNPRLRHTLVAALALGAALALVDALRGAQDAELEVVRAQVGALRDTALALESRLGQPPLPCGDEAGARAALASPEALGPCGAQLLGRVDEGPGPYWIEVDALGGVAVHGLARRRGEVLHVLATREHGPILLETP